MSEWQLFWMGFLKIIFNFGIPIALFMPLWMHLIRRVDNETKETSNKVNKRTAAERSNNKEYSSSSNLRRVAR